MADPIQNQQFATSLFAPALDILRRYNAGRLSLAESDRRRRQQLEDQQSERQQRVELQNLVNRGALDRQESVNRWQDRKITEADARGEKMDKAKVDAERRKAYAAYVQLGGNKALSDFADGEDGIGEINVEAGKLGLKGLRAKIKIGGDMVRKRTANLRARVDDRQLEDQATQLAIKDLSLNASGDATAAIQDLTAGRVGIGLKKLTPEDRAVFEGSKQKYMVGLRAAQYKDPQVVDAIRGVRDAQSSLMALVQGAPALGATDIEDLSSLIPDVDEELGINTGAADFGKFFGAPGARNETAPPSTPPAQTGAAADEYGGLMALGRSVKNTMGGVDWTGMRAARSVIDNAQYAPGTLNYLVGGEKRFQEGETERERQLAALRAASPALKRAGSSVWQSVLQSLIRPEPAPEPAAP
jgi:hypothetical protein